MVEVEAKKAEDRGRPSGGLIIAYHQKKFKVIKEKINPDFRIALIENIETKIMIRICNCYARGSESIIEFWARFADELKEFGHEQSPLKITGDFNIRIGNLNSYNEEVYLQGMNKERKTMDKERNSRGKECINCIE